MELDELKNKTNIVDIVERQIQLKKQGPELVGNCIFHDDAKASLKVNEAKQIFKCFACGKGGDVIDFLTHQGKTISEAKQIIMDESMIIEANPNKTRIPKKTKPQAKQAVPTEKPALPKHPRLGEASAYWEYHTKEGKFIGYIARFSHEDGSKDIAPYTFRENGKWQWKGFDAPRPLYNLQLIAKHPQAAIIIVEGEKTAEAAQKHFDKEKAIVTTWIGGANGIKKTDFEPLKDRVLRFCPDNDIQGLSAMLQIREILGNTNSKILPLDTTKPKGWDFADKSWEPNELREYLKANMVDDIPPNSNGIWKLRQIGGGNEWIFGMVSGRWTCKELKQIIQELEVVGELETIEPEFFANGFEEFPMETEPESTNRVGGSSEIWAEHFRMLGYEKNESGTQRFYFYAYRANQTIALSPSAMTKSNLLLLAPYMFWETSFPGAKGGFSAEMAANMLIDVSLRIGIFNPEKIRGRGAWLDGNNSVFHNGNSLIVNGIEKSFSDFKTKFIYEAGYELGFQQNEPLKNTEAVKLLELCKLLNWESPVNAYLLAGWCTIAPICGSLPWRPHIWITGAAGTGKTWTFKNIVKECLGNSLLWVEGDTTEAGIRQELKQDALPVIFDEAEGEDRKAQERMQNVLTLMRGSSSSNGGKIVKGSGNGNAIKYSIRSCFAYASIGVGLTQASDRSRVSVLGLYKDNSENSMANFEKIQKTHFELFSTDFVERLQARTLANLPVIIANCKTFSAASAVVLGDQRSGDQIGTLLAGAYSLISSKPITFEKALEWVKDRDWEVVNDRKQDADEIRLLTHLMERIIKVEIKGAQQEITLGELVDIARNPEFAVNEFVGKAYSHKRLSTLGFKIDDFELLYISNTAEFVKQSLKETPWAKNHTTILKRIEGATAVNATTFGSGIKSRAVAIPLDVLFDD